MSDFKSYGLLKTSLRQLEKAGITAPTPIQERAIPPLLDGFDLVGQARTGSGKTLAFGLPLMEMIEPGDRWVQALVLVPTRELATQVASVLEMLGQPDGIRVMTAFGGRPHGPQEQALRRGAQVVVGAPGRVLDLLQRGSLKLDRLVFMVLDEADEMLDKGFGPDVKRIFAFCPEPKDRQTCIFSATIPGWVKDTAAKFLYNPVTVAVDTAPEDVPEIEHLVYQIVDHPRLEVLKSLIDDHREGQMIIFGRTKHGVRQISKKLSAQGYPVAALQGNMSQNARDRVMADFRAGRVRILMATNVAARGLDVDDVEKVVNYELPESPELLTHRLGRTGRMGRRGQAVTLLAPDDEARFTAFERTLGKKLQRQRWPGVSAARASRVPASAPGRARTGRPGRP